MTNPTHTISFLSLMIVAALAATFILLSSTEQQQQAIVDNDVQGSTSRRLAKIKNKYKKPKTVVRKSPRKLKNPHEIKYAAFGASVTWGSGIIGDRNELAYPKLLSPDGKNLAIRASGPNYPSACTYTMVGDDHLDVIILEYFADVESGLEELTRRLRERFPDAIIIILREWWPLTINNQDNVSLRNWAVEMGFGRASLHDPEFLRAFRENTDEWHYPTRKEDFRIEIQERVAQKYNCHILIMEKPTNPRDWLDYEHLFAKDFLHKSNAGHADVARRVRELVDKLGVPSNPRVGTWGTTDSCVNWFESGDAKGVGMSAGVRMNLFSEYGGNKYALEFEGKGGYLIVNNPSDKWMKLYLAYMITSPPPSKYPKMKVTVMYSGRSPVILDKAGKEQFWGDNFVHIHTMQMVGTVPPGDTVLYFENLEKTDWPFRLVSTAVTDEELFNSPGQKIQ